MPAELATGEQVLIVHVPSLDTLLSAPERRARFVATRAAIDNAIRSGSSTEPMTDQQVVDLVKQARRAIKET
ncbi:MAG TPA: hypothetical protein PL187_02830 [Caldilinea sp.]|nr:hypothetical protein [Caldilinea sp.]